MSSPKKSESLRRGPEKSELVKCFDRKVKIYFRYDFGYENGVTQSSMVVLGA